MEETTESPSAAPPLPTGLVRSAEMVGFDPVPALAKELSLPRAGVAAVVALLDEGNTVPFIARYRKEKTGELDEVQIRAIEERRQYLVELEERRRAVIASITEQGKLTDELSSKLAAASSKAELEDLYAPYRQRRKTRASIARDKGLEPLALRILAQPDNGEPLIEAQALVNPERGVATVEEAIAGARDIAAEVIADTAEVRAAVRRLFVDEGELLSEVMQGKADEPTKFEQYYGFREAVRTIPSHRFLAIRRGESEGVLRATVLVDATKVAMTIERVIHVAETSPWRGLLREAIADAQKRLLGPSIENDVRAELKQRSDLAAVDIFASNLRNLMLSAPLGGKAVIGIDPGLRTGCKCVAVDLTGRFLGTVTIYLTQGDAQLAKAKDELIAFVSRHPPAAIAVGNGTGGRETETFVRKVLTEAGKPAPVVAVNEAGASVYSASDLAREEFPELDLTIRGAISIARRLQDPLAELVKIEPKAIGVGQYQHDVHQPLLAKKLGDVVESCVNHVGVELNTASAQLLQYVAGIGKSLAKKIVVHRDTHGRFRTRAQLLEVAGLGPRAFEQAAGFLRIRGGEHPLDGSAVHPERYDLVEKMATDSGVPMSALIGNQQLVDTIDLSKYVDPSVGELTLRDIVAELSKPGRDPRAEFEPPRFRDDVTTMEDLKPGMVLEGVVTNVTAFGAFVDIGVHNDGLVHVSQLSDKFVSAPSEVVKVGERLTVRVLEIDTARRRIALSARSSAERVPGGGRPAPRPEARSENGGARGDSNRRPHGAPGGGNRNDRARPEPGSGAAAPAAAGQAQRAPAATGEEAPTQARPRRGGGAGRPEGRNQRRDPRTPLVSAADAGVAPGPHAPGASTDARDGSAAPRPPRQDERSGGGGRGADRSPDNRGAPRNDARGPDNRGAPRNDARGPDNRGAPRNDARSPDNRGAPRNDARGPDNRGAPRNDARSPDNRGAPRNDARGADPRSAPPPRGEDRGPPREAEGPGYGISGFVNNPFAKLNLPRPKRP